MEHKEKEVVIDIENSEANANKETPSDSKWGKKSLNKLVGGILSFNGSSDDEEGVDSDGGSAEEPPNESTKLLGDKPLGRQGQGAVLPVEKERERERRKGGKVKKVAKPPRPPKGPTLDAADMRLLKEISRIAIKKRERMERLKALKKMKTGRLPSALSASSLSSSSSMWSSAATISAMFVTVFFFLVLILQGLSSSTGSNVVITGAPQPAPETIGLSPVQFYKTVMSDDGAAPSFLPPKCVLRFVLVVHINARANSLVTRLLNLVDVGPPSIYLSGPSSMLNGMEWEWNEYDDDEHLRKM